jgi:hypothetical protein
MEGDVHAKNNQEGSAGLAHVAKGLREYSLESSPQSPEDYPQLGV